MTSVASVLGGLVGILAAPSVYAQPASNIAFILHETPYAQVVVSAWAAGDAGAASDGSRCVVLFGVNSKGERTAWPKDCPEAVQADALEAASRWRYLPGAVRKGEVFARFHATFVYPVDGAPFVEIPNDLVAQAPAVYPEGLVFRSRFKVVHRPPLKLRGVDLDTVTSGERCEAVVAVSSKGKPVSVDVTSCHPSLAEAVAKYVNGWRWAPLEENGQGFTGETTVVVRLP